jgi:hypothetical protein
MKKKILMSIGAVAVLIITFVVIQPIYSSWKDERITAALETKVIPFVNEKEITFFSETNECKQVQYDSVDAASPQGCAYIWNQTDESKKDIPDFNSTDQSVFNRVKADLAEVPFKKFIEIVPEYPLFYRAEHVALEHDPIGTGFHIECAFCRTRYVYWPNYRELPPDIEGEIRYIPIDENWYRVDQDWN